MIVVEGQWRLAIMSGRWRLKLQDERQAITGDSPTRRIEAQISYLDGQVLETASVDARACATALTFDLGARLEIRGSYSDSGELWTLYQPRERHVSLRAVPARGLEVASGLTTETEKWVAIYASNRSGAP